MSEKFINILIAEDNKVSREMLARILETQQFNVIHAAHADEAIEKLEEHDINLALVDINMVPRGGFEFVRHLIVNSIDLPVVIVTGSNSSDILLEASGLGVKRVLQKPVQPKRLLETVNHILKRLGLNPNPMGVTVKETKFSHADIMRKVIELAEKNYKSGKGGPYAAIVTDKDGQILGQGTHGTTSRADPTAHAEVMAIRQASEKLDSSDLSQCLLYVSSEPTLMGKALIVSVGLDKVYYGLSHDEIKTIRSKEDHVRQAMNNETHEARYELLAHEEAMDMFQGWLASLKEE